MIRTVARTRHRKLMAGLGSLVAVGSGAIVGTDVSPVDAAFPGRNGRIYCQSNRTGNPEIFAFNPDGSDPRQLTFDEAADIEPTPSPDGTRIAFTSTRRGDDQEIFVMYEDGSGVKRLTTAPGEDRPGTWSPDSRQIAFHSARFPAEPGLGHSSLEIMTMNADGTNQTRLTKNNAQDSFAHWSPDGDRIAFTTNRDSFVNDSGQLVLNYEIYTMAPDGTHVRRVTDSPGEDAHAHWSPDGTQLVFHSRRDFPSPTGFDLEIYRINADGTNPVRLTGVDDTFDAFPAWSPDGKKIVWSRKFPEDVFVMNAKDGSNRTNITDTPGITDTRCDWGRLLECTITSSGQSADIVGTPGDDVICGSDGNDRILAGGGNDVIYAGGGAFDQVIAGAGDDIVFGEAGADNIQGGDGHDTLFGDQGNDILDGGKGDDIVSGSEGTDSVFGGADDDECYGESRGACERGGPA